MSGIKQKQPLALHVHCGAHCPNLIAQKACLALVLIRNALDWVNQLGVLFSQSGKFKTIHAAIAHAENPSCAAVKPLCPTRWAVQSKAMTAVLSQYGSIPPSLQEMAMRTSVKVVQTSLKAKRRNEVIFNNLFEKAMAEV